MDAGKEEEGRKMFKEQLTALRRQARLTQAELGRRLGVSATTIYKWEHGQCEPGIDSLNTMARIFGVSVDALCGGDPGVKGGDSSEAIVMNRALRRMTAEERQKLLAVSRTLFAHAFEDRAE